jgi:hypothetical protein
MSPMIMRSISAAWMSMAFVLWSSAGMAETPYYAGKTITIVAGTKAGDVYDLYARLFAQYMPKYIPGNPNRNSDWHVSCAFWLKEKRRSAMNSYDGNNRHWLRVFFAFGFAVVSQWISAGSIAAQTSTYNPPGIIRGVTEQGFSYMTGGVGSGEREIMQSWAGDYNLKLAFAETSGVYVSDVALSIEKDGRQMVRTTTNGPWFYIKLPPGRYTVEAMYEDESKQIKNLQLVEGSRVTRLVHWDSEEQS